MASPDKTIETTLEEEEAEASIGGCGILGRHPILSVVCFAAVGIGTGIGLSVWEPSDMETKEIVLQWIGLIGDLFIRALKAIVLPLVFVNVVISVVDMMVVGRASSVGIKTVVLYTLTTLIASIIGLISILSFQSLFKEGDFGEEEPTFVKLGCNAEMSFITEGDDGSITCSANGTEMNTMFEIDDISGSFVRVSTGARDDISLSDTIYQGVFLKLITQNIFLSFVEQNFAAVIVFAICFGVALGKIMFKKNITQSESPLVMLFTECSELFLTLINWVIAITPFAVFSLISQAIGSQTDLGGAFANVGWLIAASLVGFILHFIIVDICLLGFLTKSNPFDYLKHIIPAQTTALACASSAATLPVTLRCVKNSGMVPDDIRNFVLPLGATVNMDGSAIYFPCACIWLAFLNGVQPTAASYILLIILSTVGSVGTAPVPSSALVLIITAYNTVFGGTGTPNGFEFVVAIDWFLDRCITALNVTGDTVVSRIIACRTPMPDGHADADGDYEKGEKIVEADDSSGEDTPEETEHVVAEN